MATTQQSAVVQLAADGGGKKVFNLKVQAYVDPGDGTGPALATVYMQAVACQVVDANGNPVDPDDAFPGSDWKRQMLDETRAIRIGMQMLAENRRDFIDCDEDLISQAQALREEPEDDVTGKTEAG